MKWYAYNDLIINLEKCLRICKCGDSVTFTLSTKEVFSLHYENEDICNFEFEKISDIIFALPKNNTPKPALQVLPLHY